MWLGGALVTKTDATPKVDGAAMLAATAERVAGDYTGLIERFCTMETYVALGNQLAEREKAG